MIEHFFKPIFYTPLYNALVFLILHIPHADLGIAMIIMTVVIRLIIFPLTYGAIKTQVKMKELEPQMNEIKAKYKDNQQEQAKQMMEFYKKNEINPLGGLLPLLIQLPVVIAFYAIVSRSGLPAINPTLLYSFIHAPATVSVNFLGLINIAQRSLLLAAIVAVTQIIQVQYSIPAMKKAEGTPTFKDDLARSMNMQARFVLPLFTAYIAYITSGAVALYLITGNIFAIGQELYLRQTIKKPKNPKN